MMMTTQTKKKIAVLVSGNGTNLQTIIDKIEAGVLNANIAIVISNIPDVYALKRAKIHGISTFTHNSSDFSSRKEYDKTLVSILKKHEVELVVLAGFMRILSNIMIEAFPQAIVNIHPALLPSFPGLHAQQQAIDYGVKFSGCTVHFVDTGTDTGPIILQAVVPIVENETESSLSIKIQKEEHRIYPQAIKLFIDGALHIKGRNVLIQK